jgi:hypothetical protein
MCSFVYNTLKNVGRDMKSKVVDEDDVEEQASTLLLGDDIEALADL